MSEQMARALGAKSPSTITIAGKSCQARGLSALELLEAERKCLRNYRRSFLETYHNNRDMLPGNADEVIQQKMDEAAKWDVEDLPPKEAYATSDVHLSDKIINWACDYFNADRKSTGKLRLRRLVVTALDQGVLSERDYRRLTGKSIKKGTIPYVNWWITATFDGIVTMLWLCFKGNGITEEQLHDELRKRPAMLIDVAREIEHLSSPELGNG